MSSYFKKEIACRILTIIKANLKTKHHGLLNEDKIVSILSSSHLQCVSGKQYTADCWQFELKSLDDTRLQLSLPEDYRNEKLQSWKGLLSLDNLVESIKTTSDGVKFKIKTNKFYSIVLNKILTEREHYGHNPVKRESDKKTILIECHSPLFGKICHPGYLNSVIFSNAIANMYESAGHKVVKYTYLTDYNKYIVDILKTRKVYPKTRPTGLLHEELNNGNNRLVLLWKNIKEDLIREYRTWYKELGIDTEFVFESTYLEKAKELEPIIRENYQMLRNDNQSSRCSLTPLVCNLAATNHWYEETKFDKIHTVGFQQKNQVVKYASIFDPDPYRGACRKGEIGSRSLRVDIIRKKTIGAKTWKSLSPRMIIDETSEVLKRYLTQTGNEVCFEHITSAGGYDNDSKTIESRISALKGEFSEDMTPIVTLSYHRAPHEKADLIHRAPHEKADLINQVATRLSCAGIIIQALTVERISEYKFRWINLYYGIYFQCVYSRVCSFLKDSDDSIGDKIKMKNVKPLKDQEAHKLMFCMCRYEEVFREALRCKEPFYIFQYLLELGSIINECYDKFKDKERTLELQALFSCAKITLSNGLKVLGVNPLQEI